jgi:hypothetical protein
MIKFSIKMNSIVLGTGEFNEPASERVSMLEAGEVCIVKGVL